MLQETRETRDSHEEGDLDEVKADLRGPEGPS